MAETICKQCGKVCASLQGWKRHTSSAHGGYTDSELAAVSGAPEVDDVRSRMENFAQTLGGTDTSSDDAPDVSAADLPPVMPDGKRIKATPKKLKKILRAIPAKFLESADITLDNEDNDALEEASEFLADIFGVEFSVPEQKYQVQSRWWAFVWVGGIMALIFFKHKSAAVFEAMKGDTDTENVEHDNGNSRT